MLAVLVKEFSPHHGALSFCCFAVFIAVSGFIFFAYFLPLFVDGHAYLSCGRVSQLPQPRGSFRLFALAMTLDSP